MQIITAINILRPNSQWSLFGETANDIVWHDDTVPITQKELEAEMAKPEPVNNALNRLNAYRNESDPLFFKWQRGESTKEEWLNKVEEIKQRYPEE